MAGADGGQTLVKSEYCRRTVMFPKTLPILGSSTMNRHGVKQLLAHTVRKPAEVCEHATEANLSRFAQTGAPLTNALPFGETEAVLYSLVRMMAQRDSHTAG